MVEELQVLENSHTTRPNKMVKLNRNTYIFLIQFMSFLSSCFIEPIALRYGSTFEN